MMYDTAERVLTPEPGRCYGPVFTHSDDRLLFLREEWPEGKTGVRKFSVWEIQIDSSAVQMVADHRLFDETVF
ncbi:MAG: hypothetical protein RLY14_64 [Planctomycetota bacterium]|jgi:hypothetical protein